MHDIRPYKISIADEALVDLKTRLADTRWPEAETVDDWSQGVPLAYLQDICTYWQHAYDWRRCETAINAWPQFITEIDGLDIHFLHIESPHDNATPLILTHGWPGSIIEFMKVIDPLSNPTAHGGKAEDAFHLVIPSLPGYGFSAKPVEAGWNVPRIGRAWGELMARLKYDRYFAQGGDWGSAITHNMAMTETQHCAGVHVNMAFLSPSEAVLQDVTDFEQQALAAAQHYWDRDSGYSKEQSTRPQTIGYGLVDSPAAQAAWIIEKYWSWTDNQGSPEDALSRDEMLDNIMLYWLPATAASSARLYWESFSMLQQKQPPIDMAIGVSVFKHDIFLASERWYRERCSDLRYFNILEKGGHFAAFEQPQSFVEEVRACFRTMR